MSDVEKWIERWRESLAGSELLHGSDIHELESHLREEIEHLKTSGLFDEEAFLLARRRLGDTATLEEEFAKVNASRPLRNHLCWMIAGVLAYWVAVHFASAASGISLAITQAIGGSPHTLVLIGSGVRIVTFCGGVSLIVWLCARYFRPGSPSRIQITRRVRIAFLVALLVETVGFTVTRICGVVYVARTTPIEDYARTMQVESYGNLVWRLAGPVLLGALLIFVHLAGPQKTEMQ